MVRKSKSHKLRKQSKTKDSLVVLSWGIRYVLPSCGSGLLRASSFILGRCVWKVCV